MPGADQAADTKAVPEPGRNPPHAGDLFEVLRQASDRAAAAALARGVALNLMFDAVLRDHAPAHAAGCALQAMAGAMLGLTDRGALLVRAGFGRNAGELAVSVSSPVRPGGAPDPVLLRQAVELARGLRGRLTISATAGELVLMLGFPPPVAKPVLVLIEPDWPRRLEGVRRLTAAGFDVAPAADGAEALQGLGRFRPEAVLMDLYLESEDALSLAAALAAATDAPLFALIRPGCAVSGWALAQSGFSGSLESPVAPEALLAALEAAAERSVEAAELVAVQAGEDGEEDGDDTDGDHGLRSAFG